MNYHNITKCDLKNGEGIRVVLWVSGCYHYCPGCHNKQTWKHDSGILFDESARQEIFEELEKDYVTGITLSGGDPLSPKNITEIYGLLWEIKNKYPKKDVWCYTGYRFEEMKEHPIIQMIDVLVDGKFIIEKSIPSPKWCGSNNQRVIRVKESLESNEIVLL